jgi:hypothetical protein
MKVAPFHVAEDREKRYNTGLLWCLELFEARHYGLLVAACGGRGLALESGTSSRIKCVRQYKPC